LLFPYLSVPCEHSFFFIFPHFYFFCDRPQTRVVGMGEKDSDVVAHAIPANRVDDAAEYLEGHAGADAQQVDMGALRRKIDYRIIPFMFCCYVLQFLDKVMLNVRLFPFSQPEDMDMT
jgi:hypothetical protein